MYLFILTIYVSAWILISDLGCSSDSLLWRASKNEESGVIPF